MNEVNRFEVTEKNEPIDVEIDDDTDKVDELDEGTRWTYFITSHVDHEFASKVDAKKWLQENGCGGNTVIRGKILQVSERVKRIVTLG